MSGKKRYSSEESMYLRVRSKDLVWEELNGLKMILDSLYVLIICVIFACIIVDP